MRGGGGSSGVQQLLKFKIVLFSFKIGSVRWHGCPSAASSVASSRPVRSFFVPTMDPSGETSRFEKSLGLLTTRFVNLLQAADYGILDLKVVLVPVSAELQVPKLSEFHGTLISMWCSCKSSTTSSLTHLSGYLT